MKIKFDPDDPKDWKLICLMCESRKMKCPTKQQKLSVCADCNKSVPQVVIDFCNRNKERFDSKLLCKECQGNY